MGENNCVKTETEDIFEANLLKEVRPNLHSVCRKLLAKGNFKNLKTILKNEGEHVLSALEELKQHREKQKIKEMSCDEIDQNPGPSLLRNKRKSSDIISCLEIKRSVEEESFSMSFANCFENNTKFMLSTLFATYVKREWDKFLSIGSITNTRITFVEAKGIEKAHIILFGSENGGTRDAEAMILDVLWDHPELIESSVPFTYEELTVAERMSLFKICHTALFKSAGNEIKIRAENVASIGIGIKNVDILLKNRSFINTSSQRIKDTDMLSRTVQFPLNELELKKLAPVLEKIATSLLTTVTFEFSGVNSCCMKIIASDKDRISHVIQQFRDYLKMTPDNLGPYTLEKNCATTSTTQEDSSPMSPNRPGNDQDNNSTPEGHNSTEHLPESRTDSLSIPDNMTILFLGETGAGKSTAINAFVNYMKYPDIEDAIKDTTVLIRSSFSLTKRDKDKLIVTEPSFSCVDDINKTIEVIQVGASATQEPKAYNFTWTINDQRKTIKIIDTPGIGDVRGIDYDRKNFAMILDYIADYPEINAICILIRPDARRLTPAFKFCIDELLVHLHKSASKNIMFCFTGTRSTFYRPGETFPTLREHLERLQNARDVKLVLDRKTMYCFDNEGFRYLCARKRNYPFSAEQSKAYAESYYKSALEARRMVEQIGCLPCHKVGDTLCLNNTRSLILTLSCPLAEISSNLALNTHLLEKKLSEIHKLKEEGGDLENRLYIDQVIITAEKIDHPRTVCTAPSCVEQKKFHPDHTQMSTHYKTVCHDRCFLQGVQAEIFPNSILKRCAAMDRSDRCTASWTPKCLICGCSWKTHMHIRYVVKSRMEKVIDPEVEAARMNNDNGRSAAEVFIAKLQEKIVDLRSESDKILEYSAAFSTFLNKNSIIPYNDSYRQYLDYLITQEKARSTISGSDSVLKMLIENQAEYQKQINILNDAAALGGRVRTIQEINDMIEELKTMSHGSTLKEIQNLEILSVRQTQERQSVTVPMGSTGWFRNVIAKSAKAFRQYFGGSGENR